MTPLTTYCAECGVPPGALHADGCEIEQCPSCGGQLVYCGCAKPAVRMAWLGEYPGVLECREWGWFVELVPGVGFVRCRADAPVAVEDVQRLRTDAVWDFDARRFVRAEK